MFVIVTTSENGSTKVSCVPSALVVDQTLWWPPSHIKEKKVKKMRENEVVPAEDWIKMPCKLRECGPILTYGDGIALEKLYSQFSDTEAENT